MQFLGVDSGENHKSSGFVIRLVTFPVTLRVLGTDIVTRYNQENKFASSFYVSATFQLHLWNLFNDWGGEASEAQPSFGKAAEYFCSSFEDFFFLIYLYSLEQSVAWETAFYLT